jgi:hypothetical protein
MVLQQAIRFLSYRHSCHYLIVGKKISAEQYYQQTPGPRHGHHFFDAVAAIRTFLAWKTVMKFIVSTRFSPKKVLTKNSSVPEK